MQNKTRPLERLSYALHSKYHSSVLCQDEILNSAIEAIGLIDLGGQAKKVCYRSNRETLDRFKEYNQCRNSKKLLTYNLIVDKGAWEKIHRKNHKKIWYRRDRNGNCRFYYDIDSTKNFQPLKLGITVTAPEVILPLCALCSRFKTF
jgi:hypothetical protein